MTRRILFQIFATFLVLLTVGAGALILYALSGAVSEHGPGWLGELATSRFGREFGPSAGLVLTASGLAVGTALILIWRAADRSDARAIALFLGFLSLFWTSLVGFIVVSAFAPSPFPEGIRKATSLLMVLSLLSASLVPAAFLRVAAFFPTKLDPRDSKVGPRAARLLDPRIVWGGAVGLGTVLFLAVPAGSVMLHALAWAATVILVPGAVLGAVHLFRIGYGNAPPEDRGRVRWMVAGFIASGLSLIGSAVFLVGGGFLLQGLVPPTAEALAMALAGAAPLFAVLGVIVGVFFSGSLDSELVVRQTTVYGSFLLLLTFLFAGVESFLSILVADWLEASGRLGTWISGLVTALAAAGLQGPVKRMVARREPEAEAADGDLTDPRPVIRGSTEVPMRQKGMKSGSEGASSESHRTWIVAVMTVGVTGVLVAFLLLRLSLAPEVPASPLSQEASGVTWTERVEVDRGEAYQGPWRMNESDFRYVDAPTVGVGEEGLVAHSSCFPSTSFIPFFEWTSFGSRFAGALLSGSRVNRRADPGPEVEPHG